MADFWDVDALLAEPEEEEEEVEEEEEGRGVRREGERRGSCIFSTEIGI